MGLHRRLHPGSARQHRRSAGAQFDPLDRNAKRSRRVDTRQPDLDDRAV